MGDSGNAETHRRRTSTSRSASRRRRAAYTGVADQPVRVAPGGATASEQPVRVGPAPHPERAARPTSSSPTASRRRPAPCCATGTATALDEAVIYRGGTWYLRAGVNDGGHRAPDRLRHRGGHRRCARDLDGDGVDEPVLFRNGTWTVRAGFDAERPRGLDRRVRHHAGDQPVARRLGRQRRRRPRHPPRRAPGTCAAPAAATGATAPPSAYGLQAGDRPVAGDWDGDGDDDAGIFRGGTWYLRSTAERQPAASPAPSRSAPAATSRSSASGADRSSPGIGTFRPSA